MPTSPQPKSGSESTSVPAVNSTQPNSVTNVGSSPVTSGSPNTSTSLSANITSTKTTFDHAAALRSIGKGVGKNLRSRTASLNLCKL